MRRENAPDRLLVEGSDDKWSVINLMKQYGVDWDDTKARLPLVQDCGGIDGILKSVGVAVKTYERLGLVIDANSDLIVRWSRITSTLQKAGIKMADSPAQEGLIFPGIDHERKVGVWLMPDNNQMGKLEDFLSTLIPSGDCCWEYADQVTKKAKDLGAPFMAKDSLKARIHTWLAWQEKPGVPFGTAINAAYFKHDSPVAIRFVNWFRKLFLK